MDITAIITSLCCLLVLVLFFRFKPHFFILLNGLARINGHDTKNLQYIDQDADTEIKPELSINSWLALPPERFIVFIFVFAILSFLTYVLLGSFSGVLVQIGNAQFSAGNEEFGVVAYNLVLEFNHDLNIEIEQCYAEDSQGHYEQAISHCNKAIEIDDNFAAAYFRRGYAYLELKQYDEAITDFTKDIEINPKEPQAWLNRGLVYFQQNKNDLAISDCSKAIELEGKYWNAYFCLGLAFTNQGKYELAINNFDKAIEFIPSTNPNTSILYCMKGVTYTKMGDFESAFASLEQGVKLGGTGENDWCKSALENVRQRIPTQ